MKTKLDLETPSKDFKKIILDFLKYWPRFDYSKVIIEFKEEEAPEIYYLDLKNK